MKPRSYKYIDKVRTRPEMKYIALDIETTGLNPRLDSIHGIAFAVNDEQGFYTADLESIRPILEDESVDKIFHNAVFDVGFLQSKGFPVKGRIYDTMIMAHLINPDRKQYGLKFLSQKLIGDKAIIGDAKMKKWLSNRNLGREEMVTAPLDLLTEYAAEDVLNTYALFNKFVAKMKHIREWCQTNGFKRSPIDVYLEEEADIIPVVVDMQLKGVRLDLDATYKREKLNEARMAQILVELPYNEEIRKAEKVLHARIVAARIKKNKSGKLKKIPKPVVFNWTSNDHLKALMYEIYKEPILKHTLSGKPSMDGATLEHFAEKYPWMSLLIEYKALAKLNSTYLKNLLKLQENEVIHASYNITGTATGRFSSSKPNLQNIPKHGHVKELFIPRDGCKFVYLDYSQLELRIAAHLSGDELLVEAYKQGLDLHKMTAAAIFQKPEAEITDDERNVGKTINFAIIYNASGYRLADILGHFDGVDMDNKPAVKKAVALGDAAQERLFNKYTKLHKFIKRNCAIIRKYKLSVTAFGRVRLVPLIDSDSYKDRNHALKAGFNMLIQSFGASITKRSMIQLHKKGYQIVNQIHDAIIIELEESDNFDEQVQDIKRTMETVIPLKVPLVAEPKILTSFEEK